MLALQVSIGALNDLVDVGLDSGRKPGKPIPRGVVRPVEAAAISVAGLLVGLVLALASGLPAALVALAGVACGYAYDLRLSRTAWSWLPLAMALPLVPLYAWLGVSGTVPAGLPGLLPAGVLAGAGLALGNGLADEERDRLAGLRTAVVVLGRRRGWIAHAAALLAAVGLAVVTGPGLASGSTWRPVALGVAVTLVGIGIVLAAARSAGLRERGWEVEAVGVAVLASAWLAGLSKS